ncbi:hypothetical protein PM082_002811 [Marasmius tenuissimus]|nr:hypothetical protein PM082_002811 [Marasmius tenuissimus]
MATTERVRNKGRSSFDKGDAPEVMYLRTVPFLRGHVKKWLSSMSSAFGAAQLGSSWDSSIPVSAERTDRIMASKALAIQ